MLEFIWWRMEEKIVGYGIKQKGMVALFEGMETKLRGV